MAVRIYSDKRDGETKLNAYFKVREFACHDGSDTVLIDDALVQLLGYARNYFGRPITINSGYRTPAYNKQVGGVSNSQHVQGKAADIVIEDVPPNAVASYFESLFPNHGIGLYSSFVHIDTRGRKSYWINNGSSVVTSFRLGDLYKDYDANKIMEEEKVTQKEFNIMMDNYLATLAEKDPGEWSEEAREFVCEHGLMQGDADGNMRWKSFLTREEMAQLLYNEKGGK